MAASASELRLGDSALAKPIGLARTHFTLDQKSTWTGAPCYISSDSSRSTHRSQELSRCLLPQLLPLGPRSTTLLRTTRSPSRYATIPSQPDAAPATCSNRIAQDEGDRPSQTSCEAQQCRVCRVAAARRAAKYQQQQRLTSCLNRSARPTVPPSFVRLSSLAPS